MRVIAKPKHMWVKMKCNEGGCLLMRELEIPIMAVGVPKKHAMKLFVNDWILREPAKGERERLHLEKTREETYFCVQPPLSTAYRS